MSLELKRGNVRSFILDVKIAGRTKDTGSSNRAVGDLTETMPVFHVGRYDGHLVTLSRYIGVSATVDRRLESEHKGFNRPLELNKMDAVRALVQVLSLTTVNTDKRESNAVNEDVMDFRKYEHVVDVKIKSRDLWRRKCRSGEIGSGGARIDNSVVDVLGRREAERNETLTVWDRHRRESKARIRVEPEEKWYPKLKIVMRFFVRLVTIEDLSLSVSSDWSSGEIHRRKSWGSLSTGLLAHATLPGWELILRDAELTVENVGFAGVGINRVGVNFEVDLVEDTLTRVVTVAVENTIGVVRFGTGERGRRSTNDNVGDHVSEEIAVLRNRDSNVRVERYVVGRYLEVLEGNRNIWLMMRVYEKNVRTFKIGEGWVDVGFASGGTTFLDLRDVFTEKAVSQ